jgi:arylsulfatase A-like enzyme
MRNARRSVTTWMMTAAALAAVSAGCAVAPPNVIVITLDTTRADRLAPYGFMDAPMPALEQLANEGAVFLQASSVAPLTLPAHASLFTGLLPPHHGVRDNADPPLADGTTTLAETLRARGYRTGAFVASVVLDRDRGLAQGFETYHGVTASTDSGASGRQRRADAVIDDALRWLDTVGESRFFLWAHLYDAHRPYDAPEPYRSRYAHDPYVGEIAFMDGEIGRLLRDLERRRLLDRTVIVVAGDHGESLGDHGESDHGVFVYESVLRVPLIIRGPGVAPARISEVVRLTDVMPTVLDLVSVEAEPGDGASLTALMRGHGTEGDRDVYAESLYPERFGLSALRAVRVGRFKLIEAPRPELYDLDRDPFEQRNIIGERSALAEMMRRQLAGWAATDDAGRDASPRRTAGVSRDVEERLAALGYVGSRGAGPAPTASGRPDPKDCVPFSIPRISAVLQPDHSSSRAPASAGCELLRAAGRRR